MSAYAKMSRVGDVIGRLQSNVHGLINITNDVFKHENEPRFDAETANGVDESKCSPDVDFEEDLYFEDDKILRHQNRKLALLTQQSGYMYVKVRSHIVPFFYRYVLISVCKTIVEDFQTRNRQHS